MELSLEEWKLFARGVISSYFIWWKNGKPGYMHPSQNLKFFQSKINPVAGSGESSVLNNDLRIELQQFADYIHLHYRTYRLEFTVDEFLEFADEVDKARETLTDMEIMKDYPKRIGYNHIMQPKGRVTSAKNSGNFAIDKSRFIDENIESYDSLIYDDNSETWEEQIVLQDNAIKKRKRPGKISRFVNKIVRSILRGLNSAFRFFD